MVVIQSRGNMFEIWMHDGSLYSDKEGVMQMKYSFYECKSPHFTYFIEE